MKIYKPMFIILIIILLCSCSSKTIFNNNIRINDGLGSVVMKGKLSRADMKRWLREGFEKFDSQCEIEWSDSTLIIGSGSSALFEENKNGPNIQGYVRYLKNSDITILVIGTPNLPLGSW